MSAELPVLGTFYADGWRRLYSLSIAEGLDRVEITELKARFSKGDDKPVWVPTGNRFGLELSHAAGLGDALQPFKQINDIVTRHCRGESDYYLLSIQEQAPESVDGSGDDQKAAESDAGRPSNIGSFYAVGDHHIYSLTTNFYELEIAELRRVGPPEDSPIWLPTGNKLELRVDDAPGLGAALKKIAEIGEIHHKLKQEMASCGQPAATGADDIPF